MYQQDKPLNPRPSSDDDDEGIKPSVELKGHDEDLLKREQEEQDLLASDRKIQTHGPSILERFTTKFTRGRQPDPEHEPEGYMSEHTALQRRRPRKGDGDSKHLSFEMEEIDGFSDHSSDLDRETLEWARQKTKVWLLPIELYPPYTFGAYNATTRTKPSGESATLRSNGTSDFYPTTILISLDGFRADFLQMRLTPTLSAFIQEGVSPKYMTPSFPSVTFPNHFTLVTGLYPESHGVVGNTFWDPSTKEEFYYTNTSVSMKSKWWLGEPIWQTAEEHNVPTAVHMWPGSEAHINGVDPTHLDRYNGSEELSIKTERILSLLDKPGPKDFNALVDDPRPSLIAAYVPNVDAAGHLHGPNSTEMRKTIMSVDKMLQQLLEGLEHRNLTNVVNVVVVSDHGMATTSTERVIQLEDLIDGSLIEHIDGWPHFGLRPKDSEDIPKLYKQLSEKASAGEGFDVYLKDENMPDRYHFTKSDRIAPLWVMPHAGWALATYNEFNVKAAKESGDVYHPRGIHGYDHENSLMRAIFVARGPAFPYKPGSRLGTFQNTEVYNIICDSIGVQPKPNNGTLRLPFKTQGVHHNGSSDSDEQNMDNGLNPTQLLPDDPSPTPTLTEDPPEPTRKDEDKEKPSPKAGPGNRAWQWAKGKLNWMKGKYKDFEGWAKKKLRKGDDTDDSKTR
ncbi:MAG: hypothetical protein M1831_002791 [Alyxoria varia]|nr:MAG: hypothetical protein M1831_002791 [Alyxoria varia]